MVAGILSVKVSRSYFRGQGRQHGGRETSRKLLATKSLVILAMTSAAGGKQEAPFLQPAQQNDNGKKS
jgi:hypothetical protein